MIIIAFKRRFDGLFSKNKKKEENEREKNVHQAIARLECTHSLAVLGNLRYPVKEQIVSASLLSY
jgi:hypothetical protein